jgi:ring-1,2-phenylacetyl-CoA epoxidase subunit PaaE
MLTFHSLRVAEIHPEAEDAVGISLEVPPELHAVYRGLAGQHVVVRTEINDEENRRTYSLVNAPGEWPLRIVVRVHSAGNMSRYLAEQLSVGDHLDVLPPNGSFTPRRSAESPGTYVAFASGCGITPVLSVLRSLLTADSGNRVILFYGNANSSRAMCLEELLALKNRYLDRVSLHFVMSREPQEIELYNGRIDPQRVRELARVLFVPGEVSEYFVCGPGKMIDEVSATLRGLGVEAGRIHGEHFTVATTTTAVGGTPEFVAASASGAISVEFADAPPGAIMVEFETAPVGVAGRASDSPGGAAEESAVAPEEAVFEFEVTPEEAGTKPQEAGAASHEGGTKPQEARSAFHEGGSKPHEPGSASHEAGSTPPGAASAPLEEPTVASDQAVVIVLMDGRRRTFNMRMNDELVLDAAIRAGLELPFSCRAGVCSTCRTKLVRGEVEMEQNYALEDWEVEQGYVLACQARVKTPVLELDYDEK